MTASETVDADPTTGVHGGLDSGRATAIVAALAITQTVGYGTLYYAFPVLAGDITAATGWSAPAITAALSVSQLCAALVGVPVGRWLDRHGGRALMTAGSLAGTLLLVAWSQVQTLGQLYAVQIGIGIASAACLYEAAFAVIIAWHTPGRRSSALLALTVVAGFASTIFLPLTGWLVDQHGWRTALLVLAALQALLTTPLHVIVLREAPGNPRTSHDHHHRAVRLRAVFSDRVFWLLTASFTTNMAAISIVTVHLVAALTSWGHTATFAAGTAGLFGILSVAGRLATTGLQRRYRTSSVVAVIFAVQALAIGLLPFVGRNAIAVIAAVVGFGLGFGVSAIAKPVLLADRYDTRRYATIAGTIVVPMTIAKAGAPLAAAALHARSGTYTSVLVTTAALCAFAAVTLWATSAYPRYRPETTDVRETSS